LKQSFDLEQLIMKIPQSLKSSFWNDILVYKLNLTIIAKEGWLKQSLYRKSGFLLLLKYLSPFVSSKLKYYSLFFSIAEKKSTLGDSRTPINRYAWAKQKSRLILFCLNSTRHCTVASRHRAQAGPFAINVH